MQGPKLCNRIILASKCHAIRDAQIAEKELIKKELDEEERRSARLLSDFQYIFKLVRSGHNWSGESVDRRH